MNLRSMSLLDLDIGTLDFIIVAGGATASLAEMGLL
jgi:hypothetical protein